MDKDIRQHLNALVLNWNSDELVSSDVLPPDEEKVKWWQFWKMDASQKKNAQVIFRYLLESCDDFLKIILKKYGVFEGNKEEIIAAVSTLYDTTVTLPIWLKPFGGSLKNLVLIILPIFLDFLAEKYSQIKVDA